MSRAEQPSTAVSVPRLALSLVFDIIAVIVFVMVGRRSHDEVGAFVEQTVKVAAPFLIGLAAAWILSRAWRAPTTLGVGIPVWIVTVVAGVLLRRFAFDRSTATSFIIVTTITLMVLLLGWRFIANRIARPS